MTKICIIFRILIILIYFFQQINIIKSKENMDMKSLNSVRNRRQIYQVFKSTKYTVPKRQIIVSNGQVFTPDDFPQYHYPQQQQQNNYSNPKLVFPNFNHDRRNSYLKPQPRSPNGKFIFPDALETAHTVKQSPNNIETNLNRPVGSLCKRSFDKKHGTCQLAYECLHIIREYRVHGVSLDICSYQGSVPVICCPPEEKDDIEEIEALTRISAKKCAEYNDLDVEKLKPSKRANHRIKKCVASVPLIVGGEETLPGEYPHMVAIGWSRGREKINWACGGSLISEKFVLTAAHCTNLGGKRPDLVKVGVHDINAAKQNDNVEDIKISRIISHPKYKREEYYYDIALIELNKIVQFSKYVKPACLWFRQKMDDIEIVTAIGWGRTKHLGPKSENLLKVDLNMVNNEKCNELYRKEKKLVYGITKNQFCAGYVEGGKDTCQGDSGGSVNVKMGKYNCLNYVVGITSFGKFCAAPNSPGVYTKINLYLDWIEGIVFKQNKDINSTAYKQ